MPSEVLVYRGDLIESRHAVSCCVSRADGSLVATSGDPDLVAFWRSCAKPFQALPSVMEGAADALGAGEEEMALACASHNGEPRHVAVARGLLERSGAGVDDLVCGAHISLDEYIARAMAANGEQPTKLHNNCSGKHALMIGLARHKGWGSAGYADPEHPLQRRCLVEVAKWSGMPVTAVPHATDGCGVPSFALPLSAMALAWARLGDAAERRPVAGLDNDELRAMQLLIAAIRTHPFLIAGSRRLDTELVERTKGRIIAKVGAEGVYCAAVPQLGIGIALKVEDGATRCLAPALLGVIDLVAPAMVPRMPSYALPGIRNTLGAQVGHIEARINLDPVAKK